MAGFQKPNYTQIANVLLDDWLPTISDAELRVLLVALRKIEGYHKTCDAISITQFQECSGLSRPAAIKGIQAAIARGVLREVGTGKRGIKLYELVFSDPEPVNEVNQSEAATSKRSLPVLVNEVNQSEAATSKRSLPTKEKNLLKKDSKEKTRTPDGDAGPETSKALAALIEAWHTASGSQRKAPYANKTVRAEALRMVEAGITPDDVRAFIADRRADRFFHDKGISWLHLVDNIAAWRNAHGASVAYDPGAAYDQPVRYISGGAHEYE